VGERQHAQQEQHQDRPVELTAEIDRKIDDGNPYTGTLPFSGYAPGSTAPDPTTCTTGSNWNISNGETNCGAASLL
jgi:hypothetical protein